MSEFDPYYKWLGIPPTEQPPDYYRLLGITQFESDPDVISSAADRQMGFIRQQGSGAHASHAHKLLNELAAARLCLLTADKRKKYETSLRQADSASSPVALDDPPTEPPPQITISRPDVKRPSEPKPPPAYSNASLQALLVVLVVIVYAATRPAIRPTTAEDAKPATGRAEVVNNGGPSARPAPEAPTVEQPRASGPKRPAAATEIDLLANVDPKRDAIRGTWELQNGELRAASGRPADLLEFRDAVPDEYQFEFDAQTTAPATSVNVGLKAGSCVVNVSLDGWGGQMTGMAMVDGRFGDGNETTWRGGSLFIPNRWSHLICQIRQESVLVQCDGKTIIAWRGDRSRLSTSGLLRPASQEHLYLASWEHPIVFRAVKLRPLTPAESVAPLPARAPTGQPAPAAKNPNGNPPGTRGPDYDFERRFAQKMIDKGAHALSLKGQNSGWGGNIRSLPEWPFYIESLHIRDLNSSISDADVEDADRLHKLHDLHVDSQKLTDAGFARLIAGGALRTLTLGPNSRISVAMLRQQRQLENLNLSAPPDLDSLLAATEALPNLKGLSIEYPQQTVADLSPLERLPGLLKLRLDKATLNPQSLAIIGGRQQLVVLELQQTQWDSAGLTKLPAMPRLNMLLVKRSTVPYEAFRQFVAAAPQIGYLEFFEAPLDSDGWKLLPQLKNLKQLQAMQTSIRDEDLQYLPASLQLLNLYKAAITGEGFEKLSSGLPELQQLNLSLTSLNDAGLAQALRSTPHLKRLFVQQTGLTPEAFKRMAAQPELEEIALDGVAEPDACLQNLRTASALKLVRAQGRFSAEAKAEFLKARPNCQVQ